MQDVSKEVEVKLEDVPIVNEFIDVFQVRFQVCRLLELLSF